MPRVRRRGFQRTIGLTFGQRELLLYGRGLLAADDDPGFADDAEAKAAWRANRAELMAEVKEPGQRPRAYFKFELMVDRDLRPLEQVEILDLRSLLDLDEQRRCEQEYPMLDRQQGPQKFERSHLVIGVGPQAGGARTASRYLMRRLVRDFETAAGWHRRRDRAELAEKFDCLVTTVLDYTAGLEAQGLMKG